MEDYNEGHSSFEAIYKKQTPWVNNKSFFWIMWGKYEERFSNFDFASELYERGMRYHAQVHLFTLSRLFIF